MSSMEAMTTLPCLCWIFCRALVMDRWNVADALHSPKGMRRLSNKPSSQANAVFLLSHFLSGICQKAHGRSILVKIFAFPFLDRLLFILGRGKASFTVTSFNGRKSQQKLSSPVFQLTMTIPLAHSE